MPVTSAPVSLVKAIRTVRLAPRTANAPVSLSKIGTNCSEMTLEIDSHADTTCLGGGALKIMDYETPVSVVGYDPALGSKEYSIISGVVGYTQPHTGERYHLVINQAVHIPDLDHHLLCPMQCRSNGVTINECPRMFCKDPSRESHSIVTKDEYGDEVVIPFVPAGRNLTLSH